MDEFLFRAAAGGVAIALAAGPIGAFMLWRRMSFFGAAIAESAILGVVLGLVIGIHPLAGAMIVCVALALIIERLTGSHLIASDTAIGVVGHGALALALVLLVYLERVRVDLLGYLFGDILAVSWTEAAIAAGFAIIALSLLALLWRPLLSATHAPEIAAAEGVPVRALSLFYALMLALLIALGLKLVGALLIVALLVMPAATARSFARSPVQMAVLAALLACVFVILGIALSALFDWPAGPAIALVSAAAFAATRILPQHQHS